MDSEPGGGREAGNSERVDRWVQQAVLQILEPILNDLSPEQSRIPTKPGRSYRHCGSKRTPSVKDTDGGGSRLIEIFIESIINAC